MSRIVLLGMKGVGPGQPHNRGRPTRRSVKCDERPVFSVYTTYGTAFGVFPC